MIYPFFKQLEMAIKFILLGLFISIFLDVIAVFNFKKKIPQMIIQILFWIGMTFIICNAVLVISKGYLPIYTFLFFLLGYFLYILFLKKQFIKTLENIISFLRKNKEKILMYFFPLEVYKFIKKLIKSVCKKIKKIYNKLITKIKSLFKSKKKEDEEAIVQ
ncbi:MAG TPA: spore cortex biosynthesis protein YabQ [Bacilli bacterium]